MAKDLFELLHEDHQQVQKILEKMTTSAQGSQKTRQDLVEQLSIALLPHMKAEEGVLYPVLRDMKETKDLALQAYEEHHVAETVFKELQKLDTENETWLPKAKVFMEIVNHHIHEEESEIFEEARDNMEEDDLDDLLDQFISEKDDWTNRLAA